MAQSTTAIIWSDFSADLRRFIRRRVSDEPTAADLLQETFMRIHRAIGSLAEADRLGAWIYQIARNVVHDHYRKSATVHIGLGESDAVAEKDDPQDCHGGRAGAWLDEL